MLFRSVRSTRKRRGEYPSSPRFLQSVRTFPALCSGRLAVFEASLIPRLNSSRARTSTPPPPPNNNIIIVSFSPAPFLSGGICLLRSCLRILRARRGPAPGRLPRGEPLPPGNSPASGNWERGTVLRVGPRARPHPGVFIPRGGREGTPMGTTDPSWDAGGRPGPRRPARSGSRREPARPLRAPRSCRAQAANSR